MGVAAVYCRISKDREGRAEGVAVQEQRGRAYAAERWPDLAARVYIDNDLTAADPDTFRPAYAELLADVRRGDIAQVVCAEQSRLTRQPAEWEDLCVTLAKAGITEIHGYRTGPTPVVGSRLLGRVLAAVDAEEVERLRARINDRLAALAAEGRPSGGGSYGYRRTRDAEGRSRLEVIADRAEVIRDAAAKILSGWSLAAVAAHLDEIGAPTARGGRWHPTTVRAMLTNGTVAGQRVHKGEIVRDGDWEPILDIDTWRAVRAKLSEPLTVSRRAGQTTRARRSALPHRRYYLLTGGTAICGACGARLAGQPRYNRDGSKARAYNCSPYYDGCAGVSIHAEKLEAYVVAMMLDRLDRPVFTDQLATDNAAERAGILARLAGIDERRADLARLWAAGHLGGVEWDAARAVLDADRDTAAADLAALPSTAEPVDATLLRAAWDTMTLDERRTVVDRLVASVTVAPFAPGAQRRFDPGRVTIAWKG